MLTMFRVILTIFLQYKYCQWFTIVNGLKVVFNLNTGIFNCFIFTMKYIFHTRFLSFWTSHIFNGFTFCGGAENVVNGFKFCFFVNFERKRDIFGLGILFFFRSGAFFAPIFRKVPVDQKWGQQNFHALKCPFRAPQSMAFSPFPGVVLKYFFSS